MNKSNIRVLLNNTGEDRTYYTIPRYWNLYIYEDIHRILSMYYKGTIIVYPINL